MYISATVTVLTCNVRGKFPTTNLQTWIMAASTTAVASSSLSQSEQDALKVAVFQRLHPRAYLERFLAENIRPDKRLCDGFRDVHVNVGEFFFGNQFPKMKALF